MGKPIQPFLRTGISFTLVPVGPGVYSERADESRDLSPERLAGGSWWLELPKAAGICIMFPCLLCVATGCCRAQQPKTLPVPGHTGPLVQPATGPHPTPPSLRLLGFCLSQEGLSVGLGSGCQVVPPPPTGLGGPRPKTLQ